MTNCNVLKAVLLEQDNHQCAYIAVKLKVGLILFQCQV